MTHPTQPLEEVDGILRYKKNAIVRFLLDTSQYSLNALWKMDFSDEDWRQFYQLIGYSKSGYDEIRK